MHALLSAILAAACFVASCEVGLTSPVGLWLAKDGAKIRISPCGRNLCGFFVQSSPQIDPDTGPPMTGKHNVDPAKRHPPLVRVQILISIHHQVPATCSVHLSHDD